MLNSSSPDTPREFTGEESAETLVGRWCSALHHPLACRPAARRRRLCCTARAAGSLCPRPAPPRASAPPGGRYGRDMAQRLAARTHRVGLISASRISANRIGCASRLYHGCLTAVSRSLSRPNLVRISRAPPSPPQNPPERLVSPKFFLCSVVRGSFVVKLFWCRRQGERHRWRVEVWWPGCGSLVAMGEGIAGDRWRDGGSR